MSNHRSPGQSRLRSASADLMCLVALVLAWSIGAEEARAYTPLGSDLRISNVGTDTDPARGGSAPAIAYNAAANEYLVVWQGDGLPTDNENEIFGQRVSAIGAELGPEFRISNAGTDPDTTRDAGDPAVAYNPTAGEYLVTWEADGLVATDDEFEIFGQRVSAAGAELGSDFRISNVGTEADIDRGGFAPAVAYSPVANEYLVTWLANGFPTTDDKYGIFGQRVSAAGGELGGDFQISNTGLNTDGARDSDHPSITYSSGANEYLVVWEGDVLSAEEKFEVFGQRLGPTGAEVGSDFRISNVGDETDAARDAANPSVTYSSGANEYLVVWEGDGLVTDNELEIFGQRVNAAGVDVGSDLRISNAGADADAARRAVEPSAAYSSADDEYMVTWEGDGFLSDNEVEIFGQRLSAASAELGSDFRISTVGGDADPTRTGQSSAVAYGSGPDEYLATWEGDGLPTNDEFEIFARRLGFPPEPISATTPPPAAASAAKKKCKKGKRLKKGKCVKKKRKKK